MFVAHVVCPFIVSPPYTNKKNNNKENGLSLLLLAHPVTRKKKKKEKPILSIRWGCSKIPSQRPRFFPPYGEHYVLVSQHWVPVMAPSELKGKPSSKGSP